MKIAKKLYHASPECAYESIDEKGLVANFSVVYAAESLDQALGFMSWRLLDHWHMNAVEGVIQIETVNHNAVYVWEIDTTNTDQDKWEESSDHNAAFFKNAKSYAYTGNINRKALTKCHIVSRETLDKKGK